MLIINIYGHCKPWAWGMTPPSPFIIAINPLPKSLLLLGFGKESK